MERAGQSTAEVLSLGAPAKGESGLTSTESVLNPQKLIFAGSPPRQRDQYADADDRCDEQHGRFHTGRKKRESGVDPREEKVRLRNHLDDRRIRRAGGPKGTEHGSAEGHREDQGRGKHSVLPHRVWNKRNAVIRWPPS
jgi:hypothetical protein